MLIHLIINLIKKNHLKGINDYLISSSIALKCVGFNLLLLISVLTSLGMFLLESLTLDSSMWF